MRKNGFKRPFHKLQIASWVYMTFIVTTFSFLALPILPNHIKVVTGLLFASTLITVIILG